MTVTPTTRSRWAPTCQEQADQMLQNLWWDPVWDAAVYTSSTGATQWVEPEHWHGSWRWQPLPFPPTTRSRWAPTCQEQADQMLQNLQGDPSGTQPYSSSKTTYHNSKKGGMHSSRTTSRANKFKISLLSKTSWHGFIYRRKLTGYQKSAGLSLNIQIFE
jgi:hypothetical protein